MLFLKNIERIELSHWKADGTDPRNLFTIRIANLSPSLLGQRKAIQRMVSARKGDTAGYPDTLNKVTLEFDAISRDNHRKSKWLVCYALRTTPRIRSVINDKLTQEAGLKLLPWAGVAAHIEASQKIPLKREGRAFCFLPLPAKTGLPVHVNGYFEISSNRRDIW